MRYWIGLGSNLGDRLAALQGALDALSTRGVRVEAVSAVYETAPQELTDQPPFLNAAARVDGPDDPLELLALAKDVEAALGRVPGPRFGPRAIDCDLLLAEGGPVRDRRLELPHPRLGRRRFALVPLLELDPDLRLPDGTPLQVLERAIDPATQPITRCGRRLAAPRALQ